MIDTIQIFALLGLGFFMFFLVFWLDSMVKKAIVKDQHKYGSARPPPE